MRCPFSLILLFCLLTFTLAEWTVVDKNYETIALSTSFVNSTGGWVTGGTASLDPLFLFTTDGGSSFTNMGLSDSSVGAFFSIRLASETWGVAGGFGLFGTPCGAYTNDGATWNTMQERERSLTCALQGCSAVNDGRTGVLVGVWAGFPDFLGNGVKITTDGGSTWKQHNGNTGNAGCRYGDFISKDLGYVTAGLYPTTTDSVFERDENGEVIRYHLSQHLSFDVKESRYEINTEPRSNSSALFSGIISKVTDEGRRWKVMVNITGEGLYFNEISCVDANNCWAVTEGAGFGSIFHTTDGWVTYENQFNVTGGSFTAIEMQTASYGWAAGALTVGPSVTGDFDGQFWYTTDGGNTWTLDSTIKNFFPFDISAPDKNHAYASGITPIGLSSFASYSP